MSENTPTESSLREDIASALHSLSAEDKAAEDKPAEDKAAEDKPAEDKPAEDKPAEDKPAEDKPAEDKPAEDKPAEDKAAQKIADDTLTAPPSWRPHARQSWDKIPKDLQQEILNREKAFSIGIQKNAEAASWNKSMQDALAPYDHILKMEGASPAEAIQHLAHSAAMIRQGTPQQKADLVSFMVQHYGVDLKMLDTALTRDLQGQAGQPGQPQQPGTYQPLPDQTEQRISNIEQMLQQQSAAEQQQQFNSAQEKINQFAKNPKYEFFQDLSDTMANIIEAGARQGQNIELEQAYDIAAQMNPSVQQAISQKKAAEEAKIKEEALKKKRAASLSLMGNPRPEDLPADSKNTTLRQDIMRSLQNLK